MTIFLVSIDIERVMSYLDGSKRMEIVRGEFAIKFVLASSRVHAHM